MKAVRYEQFGGPEVLRWVELDAPTAGPGEIRVRVKTVAVNPVDHVMRRGLLPTLALPAGVGMDAAGVVDQVGEGVTEVAVGDEVFGMTAGPGALAEHTVLGHWAKKPASMSWEQAAALPIAAETGLRTLRDTGVRPGQTVLIDGASGSVGSAATQFAVAQGIRVIGTAGPRNLKYLAGLGAIPIAYGAGLVERVLAVAPTGVEGAIDLSGRCLVELVAIVGDPTRVVTVVNYQEAERLGAKRSGFGSEQSFDALDRAAQMFSAGSFAVRIGRVFPVSGIGEAQTLVETGEINGKVVIEISG